MPDLIALLRDCYEPTTRRDIVSAGLIRVATLTLDEDAPGSGLSGNPMRYVASITVHAYGNDEAANAQLVAQIENRLLGVESISRVVVLQLPALFTIL